MDKTRFPLWKHIFLFQPDTYMARSPPGKENNVHLLHHVWSTDTSRWQQAGTELMHCLQSHLSGSYCCPGLEVLVHFLRFQSCPKESQKPASTCSGGIRLPLPPLVKTRGQWKRGGLKGKEEIYFAFNDCKLIMPWMGRLLKKQSCFQNNPDLPKAPPDSF